MSHKSYLDLVNNVGSNIQDTSSAMEAISKRYINEIYFDILRRINWDGANYDYSFSASTQDNILPSDFGKEIAVVDSTNSRVLTRTNVGLEFDVNASGLTSSGTAERYAILESPTRVQPTTAGVISVVSSSAADATQTVVIRGVVGSVEVVESITLTGTTPAVSTGSFSRIRGISKSAVSTGYVTVTTGTQTLAILAPETREHLIKIMRLYDAPASAVTIKCPYNIKPQPMINNNDYPIIDIADLIELGATYRAWQYKRQMAKAIDFKQMYEQGIINHIWDKENQPNNLNAFSFQTYDRSNV
jgi:hypothetical protein